MKKLIPGPETFFFAPNRQREVQKVKMISDGQEVAGQTVIQFEQHDNLVLFWCEHSDHFIVKSYPVKVFNIPGSKIDFKDSYPIYHLVQETNFHQANSNIIKDCSEEINLFYAHKRPELMSSELLIVPEKSMEYLANIFKTK